MNETVEDGQRLLYKLSTAHEYVVVGHSIRRVDSLEKVLGKAMYIQDNYSKGMAFGRIVRAPVPSAALKGIDFAESAQVSGFITGVTAADIPGSNQVGSYAEDQPAFADGVIRYHGEVVAVVLGETPQAAENALARAKVMYSERPAVFDPLEALRDKILVHEEKNTNVAFVTKVEKGDIEQGLSSSYIVVDRTYRTGYQDHAYIETEGAVAIPSGDSVTIISQGMYPHVEQRVVAGLLRLPESHVRVVQATVGGAFGGKGDMGRIVAAQAAVAAWKVRRPVMLQYSREDSIITHSKRAPSVIRYRTGVDEAGYLQGVEVEIVYDAGAYANKGPAIIRRAVLHATGPYVVPNVRVSGKLVYTNKVFQGAMRGFGNPQIHFAAERNMDVAAEKLGMDPIDIRIKNVLREGSITGSGDTVYDVGLEDLLRKVREASGWDDKRKTYGEMESGKIRGIGVACGYHGLSGTKAPDLSTAYLVIRKDGSVTIYTGIVEVGQGTSTGLAQVCAEALGIPVGLIVMHTGTTDAPDTAATNAQRGIARGGAAILLAANELAERLKEVAAKLLGCGPGEVQLKQGRAVHMHDVSRKIDWADLVGAAYGMGVNLAAVGVFHPERSFDKSGYSVAYPTYSYMVVVSEVEVDPQTGTVSVLKAWPGLAAGKIINPGLAATQIHGSIIQGLGYATLEEIVLKEGRILNPTLTDYVIPTVRDVPEIEPCVYVETPYKDGPFGAKGLGEIGLIVVAPSIANAYQHATGKEVPEIPLTPERSLSIVQQEATT